MAFTTEQAASIDSSMEDFLTKRRPPEEIRHKLDLGWRIERQKAVIYSLKGGDVNGLHELVLEMASSSPFKK